MIQVHVTELDVRLSANNVTSPDYHIHESGKVFRVSKKSMSHDYGDTGIKARSARKARTAALRMATEELIEYFDKSANPDSAFYVTTLRAFREALD